MSVKPIPGGFHTVTPYLTINGAAAAIEFYKKAFAAEEIVKYPAPGGKIGHAQIKIGDSTIMLADEYPEMNVRGPKSLGGTSVSLYVHVPDVDTVTNRAIAAAPRCCGRFKMNSTATAPRRSKIRSDTSGPSRRTLRTCRRRNCKNAWMRP